MSDPADVFEPLIAACTQLGLSTALYRDPPRLRVSTPGVDGRLAEVVRCVPDDGRLVFLFSWGEEIAPADQPDSAAVRLRRVVTGK